MNNPLIHKTTENIPYPYTKEHADYWIQHHTHITKQYGEFHLLAIRNPQSQLIGSIGLGEIVNN